MNFLTKIAKEKRKEVAFRKRSVPLSAMIRLAQKQTRIRPFGKALLNYPGLIAEVKIKSPSKGIVSRKSPLALARAYAKSRADAISVLTDEEHFGGALGNLSLVRKICKQPILRKDFIIDEYQVYESKAHGADALLLIVAMLSQAKVKKLLSLARRIGLDALVEVHSKQELVRALKTGATIIGINNRNLKTLKVDIKTTLTLSAMVPERILLVSESGIETSKDVWRVMSVGADAVLVGSAIARSKNPNVKIKELKSLS